MQNRRQQYDVRNDVTRAQIMAPLAVEDRLLTKALHLRIERVGLGMSIECLQNFLPDSENTARRLTW